jgi:hypothetical protein
MQSRMSGSSLVEGFLIDWVAAPVEPEFRLPAEWLDDAQVAAELGQLERRRARDAAREAELILRLATLRPDTDDPPPGSPGARRRTWRKTEPEFPGVSEFFVDEVAHALNLGRGTAAFRAHRAWTWAECLPATLATLRAGEIDERRAGVLADVLQHSAPELGRRVEAVVLPQAGDLSLAELRRRALAAQAELDAEAIGERHEQAKQAADVRAYETSDGMAVLAADLTAEQAAACHTLIDTLARMAQADGDPRPIGAIRAAILAMLILRPADHDQPGVTVQLTVTAALEGLEGTSTAGGEVNGFAISAAQLRALLARVGALGLQTPEGGTLSFALTDPDGRLLATLTGAELARLARQGCPAHPDTDTGCDCPAAGPPPPADGYQPTAGQRRFITTRDRRCRMPTCGQRVGWADLDHVVPHAEGGATCCTNLCCLCRSHHRLKTFGRWLFRMDPDGTLHVTSPSGITRTTRPPGLRPPPPEPDPPPEPPGDDPPPL